MSTNDAQSSKLCTVFYSSTHVVGSSGRLLRQALLIPSLEESDVIGNVLEGFITGCKSIHAFSNEC